MNPENSNAVTSTIDNSKPLHCQHRSASGRRFCRLPVSDTDSGLCRKHAAERQHQLDQADFSAALIGDVEEFRSASDINHSLGELFKLQARNQISPRRAAVMAFTCNLLLHTLPAIERENESKGVQIIWDLPRPDRSEPRPENPTYADLRT
jgi:hypothetical protein